jgi:hypothetical protein
VSTLRAALRVVRWSLCALVVALLLGDVVVWVLWPPAG